LGVISDTHGLLRPEARHALADVDRILHAGDIDDPMTLTVLRAWAPSLTVVRGNVDRGPWARMLPDALTVTVEGFALYLVHDVIQAPADPKADGIAAVIYGHSHRPCNEVKGGVLYFNPGSAGPRRFGGPVSVGKLHVDGSGIRGEIVLLDQPPH
jgi:putative phosphoesterase